MKTLGIELATLLREKGLGPNMEAEGWVAVEGGAAKVRATAHPAVAQGEVYLMQVDVEAALADGRVIFESYAGRGPSKSDALSDTLEAFCRTSFDVLVEGLLGGAQKKPAKLDRFEWTHDGVVFEGVANFPTIRASKPGIAPPPAVVDVLRGAFERSGPSAQPHWYRLFYCDLANGDRVAECTVDNVADADAQAALLALPWPPGRGFYTVASFGLLLPKKDG